MLALVRKGGAREERDQGRVILSAEQDGRIMEEIRACPKSSATELTHYSWTCNVQTRRHIREGGLDCYVPAVKETLM